MGLPLWKRYNWFLVWRTNRRRAAVYSGVAAFVALLCFGEEYMWEQGARLEAEAAHKALITDIKRFDTFGAPGTTMTDWKEGTRKWKR